MPSSRHDEIRARYEKRGTGVLEERLREPDLTPMERKVLTDIIGERERGPGGPPGHVPALGILGILSLLARLYFLLVSPGDPTGADLLGQGRDVVNLQRLYLGQTAVLVGAIFIAAEWHRR